MNREPALAAHWALYSKKPGDHADYRVIAAMGGEDSFAYYNGLFHDFNGGGPSSEKADRRDSLPWITVGQVQDAGARPRTAVSLLEWSAETDGFGRPFMRTWLYVLPESTQGQPEFSLKELGEAVYALDRRPEAHQEHVPVHLAVPHQPVRTTPTAHSGLAWSVWVATAVAQGPVVITDSPRWSWSERLAVLDQVLAFVPRPLRREIWAGSWANGATTHRLRLSFGDVAGAGRTGVRWATMPDPGIVDPRLADLAGSMVELAARLPDGLRQISACLDQTPRRPADASIGAYVSAVYEQLGRLDAVGHAWQKFKSGRLEPGEARAVLSLEQVDARDEGKVADLVRWASARPDSGLAEFLVSGRHWAAARAEVYGAVDRELTESFGTNRMGTSPTATRYWPLVLAHGGADAFLSTLIDRAAAAGRDEAALVALADFIIEIEGDLRDPRPFPGAQSRMRGNRRLVTILLSVKDREDPAGWIGQWLYWLECWSPEAPPWLRAFTPVIREADESELAADLARLAALNGESQLTVLLTACRAGCADLVFPTVWPRALAAAPAPSEISLHRLKSLIGEDFRYPMSVESVVKLDILRILMGSPVDLGRGAAAYVGAFQAVWRDPATANHHSGLIGALTDRLLRNLAGDGVVTEIVDWLVLVEGKRDARVVDAVCRVLDTDHPRMLRMIEAQRMSDAWWAAVVHTRPTIAGLVGLGRLAEATRREEPMDKIAELWRTAVDQGCEIEEVLTELAPWAQKVRPQWIDALVSVLEERGTTSWSEYEHVRFRIAEGAWGPRVAQEVTDIKLRRIRDRKDAIEAERARLNAEEKDFKTALKQGQKRGRQLPAPRDPRSESPPGGEAGGKPVQRGAAISPDWQNTRVLPGAQAVPAARPASGRSPIGRIVKSILQPGQGQQAPVDQRTMSGKSEQ
jgi:hypothetical protein